MKHTFTPNIPQHTRTTELHAFTTTQRPPSMTVGSEHAQFRAMNSGAVLREQGELTIMQLQGCSGTIESTIIYTK